MKTEKNHSGRQGFAFVELCLVVLVLGLLFILSNLAIQGRQVARRNECLSNLKQMEAHKQEWLRGHKTEMGFNFDVLTLGPFTNNCPSGGHYGWGSSTDRVTCSFPDHKI